MFSVSALSICAVDRWVRSAAGAIAVAIGAGAAHATACRTGSCGKCPGLFENIGVVRDGIDTLAKRSHVVDAPDAQSLVVVSDGAIDLITCSFHYGRDRRC